MGKAAAQPMSDPSGSPVGDTMDVSGNSESTGNDERDTLAEVSDIRAPTTDGAAGTLTLHHYDAGERILEQSAAAARQAVVSGNEVGGSRGLMSNLLRAIGAAESPSPPLAEGDDIGKVRAEGDVSDGTDSDDEDGLLTCNETLPSMPSDPISEKPTNLPGLTTPEKKTSLDRTVDNGVGEYSAAAILGELSSQRAPTGSNGSMRSPNSTPLQERKRPRYRLPLKRNRELDIEGGLTARLGFGNNKPLASEEVQSGKPSLVPTPSLPSATMISTTPRKRVRLTAVSPPPKPGGAAGTKARRSPKKSDADGGGDRAERSRIEPQQQEGSSESPSAAAALLNSSQYLAYSWDSLRLGEELGTAALNEYMERLRSRDILGTYGGLGAMSQLPGMACTPIHSPSPSRDMAKLTAQQTLQIMNTLRAKTSLPPPGSDLHRIVQKNRFENRRELYGDDSEDDDTVGKESETVRPKQSHKYGRRSEKGGQRQSVTAEAETATGPKIPFKTLARLYESMCAQDADDGSSARREAHYLSAKACVEKLRSLENRACELKLRERELMQEGKKVGLLPVSTDDACRFSGYIVPDESFAAQL